MTWVINLRGLIILIYLIKCFTYAGGDKTGDINEGDKTLKKGIRY
jgi:hypothetical protein